MRLFSLLFCLGIFVVSPIFGQAKRQSLVFRIGGSFFRGETSSDDLTEGLDPGSDIQFLYLKQSRNPQWEYGFNLSFSQDRRKLRLQVPRPGEQIYQANLSALCLLGSVRFYPVSLEHRRRGRTFDPRPYLLGGLGIYQGIVNSNGQQFANTGYDFSGNLVLSPAVAMGGGLYIALARAWYAEIFIQGLNGLNDQWDGIGGSTASSDWLVQMGLGVVRRF